MKILKRIATMLLTVCLLVPCCATIAMAADGIVFFTDLETRVGDTFTITGTVVARNDTIGDARVEMTYDTTYLRFIEGEGVSESESGKLVFTGSGDGSIDRLEYDMQFQALLEGNTRLEQGIASVTNQNGETVECETGYADVTIGEGDPSKILPVGNTKSVTVNGAAYTLSEAFNENEIPTGFTAGEFNFERETFKGAVQANSGLTAAYLIDSEQSGKFWLYNAEDSSFYPFEEIMISDTYSIVILDGTNEVKMPEKYVEAALDINGVSFPAWVEPDRDGFLILYAVNNDGEKSLYLYDSLEHTYQRMETPKTGTSVAPKEESKLDKVLGVISDYLIWVLVGVGCLIFIMLILLIVMAVKLRNRNVELDELYDEYGIDEEEDTPKVQPKKNQFKKPVEEDEDEFDDYYDDDEDAYYYDDEEADDDLAELREDFISATPPSNRNLDEYYDDDDYADDDYDYGDYDEESYDDSYEATSAKSTRDDTFEMDFIDLE